MKNFIGVFFGKRRWGIIVEERVENNFIGGNFRDGEIEVREG